MTWLLFRNRLPLLLVPAALVPLAHVLAAAVLEFFLRPHEPDWRPLPLKDDLALLLFRFSKRLLYCTSAYVLLWIAALGYPAHAAQMHEALDLVYQAMVTMVVLLSLASPVVSNRVLGLISKQIAVRLRKALVPTGIFVGCCLLTIFVLEAAGYQNASESVTRSLVMSIGVIVAGIVFDRILFRALVQRFNPHGIEGEPGEAPDPHKPAGGEAGSDAAKQLFVHRLIEAGVSVLMIAGALFLIAQAFRLERNTLESVLRFVVVDPAADRAGVTIGNLLSAAVVVVVTLFLHRYFRGFMAHYVLPRVGLSRGAQFAVSSVAGYMILGLGGVAALHRVQIYIGDLDWFLAAAGVGIGFGLQEILGNFVSGLIILLERPVEVGDIVTVNGLEGEIEVITIRSTTVKTRDNVAIIVPNKEFITASVTNWSHGSPEIRLHVPVGAAYGSNVHLVKQTLLDVAKSYGRVMKRPSPSVSFVNFGASSLDFELSVWVKSPDPSFHRQVRTDLCSAIDAAFRRAKIEIPFNQLDLHLPEGGLIQVQPLVLPAPIAANAPGEQSAPTRAQPQSEPGPKSASEGSAEEKLVAAAKEAMAQKALAKRKQKLAKKTSDSRRLKAEGKKRPQGEDPNKQS
jgi:small-conductance mechanosensitive channel